jgi:AraC-like DNA-binding protein
MKKNHFKDLACSFECPFRQETDGALLEILHYEKNTIINKTAETVCLVALFSGKITISFGDKVKNYLIPEKSLFLIPIHVCYTIDFLEKSHFLIYYTQNANNFINCMNNTILKGASQKNIVPEFTVIKMNGTIHTMLHRLESSLDQNKNCKQIVVSLARSLFFILPIYYPQDKVAQFFSLAFPHGSAFKNSLENKFKTLILRNTNKIFTVAEFARLANESTSSFRNHFIKVFKMNPTDYIKRERKKLIYNELTVSNKTLQSIAELAGFKSDVDFYKYCKKNFGKTATSIRNSK